MADDVTFDVADEQPVPLSVTDPSSESADFAIGDAIIDAVSPTVDVTAIAGGHRMTVHDINGEHSFDVMDGEDGEDGEDGATGPAGPGVPTGGTAGQVLRKASATDYDTAWATPDAADLTGTLPVAHGGSGQNATFTDTSDVIVADSSNAEITYQGYAQWGNVAQINIGMKLKSELSVPASGNITNITIGTLVAGKRPAINSICTIPEYGGMATINTNGAVNLANFTPSITISTSTTLYVRATYLLA